MKKADGKRVSGIFIVICFLLFLILALLGTLFREKEVYSYFENRNLTQMPEVEASSVLSGQWGSDVESYLADHAAGRTTLLKWDTLLDMNILQRPLVNEVVVTDDVLLPWNEYETVEDKAVASQAKKLAKNVSTVAAAAESYGGRYYYVGVPCQYVFYEDAYPSYLNNRAEYTDASVMALTKTLRDANINFIDMGPVFAEKGWADYLTSTVDNHFSIYGAYLTYSTILERINADIGGGIPVLSEEDSVVTELPNLYLGSRSRKLFNLWQDGEKLSILEPKAPIPFIRTDNGKENVPVVYFAPANPWEDVTYFLYMGGDSPNTVIDTEREELPSILIYGDSFTNAVECIMYCSFDEMHSLDMRHYTDMSLGDYIKKYQPDIVVCIRDYESIISTDNNGQSADWKNKKE